jgi:DNA-binding MarR family transcriptional regulator
MSSGGCVEFGRSSSARSLHRAGSPECAEDCAVVSTYHIVKRFELKITMKSSLVSDTAAKHTNLPDVLQFMQVLWALVHGLERTSKRMRYRIGVTGPQRLVLRVVGLFPDLSAGDLATILHVHPSTLTGVLKRLIALRLLKRLDDPTDRRRAVLSLTARGARANAVSQGTVESAIADALEKVSPADRDAAKRVLERLAVHLGSTTVGVRTEIAGFRSGGGHR